MAFPCLRFRRKQLQRPGAFVPPGGNFLPPLGTKMPTIVMTLRHVQCSTHWAIWKRPRDDIFRLRGTFPPLAFVGPHPLEALMSG